VTPKTVILRLAHGHSTMPSAPTGGARPPRPDDFAAMDKDVGTLMDLLETLKVDYAWVLLVGIRGVFLKQICEPLCCLICGMRTVDDWLGRLGVWWEFFVDWTDVWDAGIGRCRLKGLIQQRVFIYIFEPLGSWYWGTMLQCDNPWLSGSLCIR
jgi:hypothetical protein